MVALVQGPSQGLNKKRCQKEVKIPYKDMSDRRRVCLLLEMLPVSIEYRD